MNIEEIQAEINKMPAALSAAGVGRPDAHLWLRSNAPPQVYISGVDMPKGRAEFIGGETVADAIAKAWDFIRAIPDLQTRVLATYSRKLADAIDYGHANNVPAKLVDPVRRAQKATSDMMLPAPTGAA